jgi:hypothetical protein
MLRQLWDFDEVEELQYGPARNESDILLSILLVNGLHHLSSHRILQRLHAVGGDPV